MRGARCGTVRKVERTDLGWEYVIVRLDNPSIRNLQRIRLQDVRVTEPGRGHHYGHCDGKPCTCGMSEVSS